MDVSTAHSAASRLPLSRSRDASAFSLSLVPDADRLTDETTPRRVPAVSDEQHATPEDAAALLCREWFERSVQGDVAAFESLYRYLHGQLRMFAESYVRSPEAAEEIVQDVFLVVWDERTSLRLQRSIKGYFYIAVRNRALNYLKRRRAEQRSTERLAREESLRVVRNTAEEQLTRDELVAKVRQLVEQLPPRTRQAYTLYYQHDLSYAEVAEVMGTAVKTVENQLARALRLIYKALDERAP